MKKEKTLFDKFIKVLTHQTDRSPPDLKSYDVVLFGGALSGIMTKNLVKFTHGHRTVFHSSLVKDAQMSELRIPFETKRIEDSIYSMGLSEITELSVAKDQNNPIKRVIPKDNAVELTNGRVIHYSSLILEPSFEAIPQSIPGFIEGLNRADGRVFAPLPKMGNPLYYSFFPLFEHGNAFIYIPEFPFENEVDQYNFLTALSTWEMGESYGLVSPIRQLTIINANDRFAAKCDALNKYLIERLSKHKKVDVLFNTKLKSIDNDNLTLMVEDKAGAQKKLDFQRLYVHVPTKANSILEEAGLIKQGKKQLEVNPATLALKEFENIFAYGEGVDLPIQRSLHASICQSHVVRHNALEYADGRKPNAEYKGQTKLPIFTGVNAAVFYSSAYNQQPKISDGWLLEKLQYYYAVGKYAKKVKKIYTSKKAGPPAWSYQKFPAGEKVREVHREEHH